MELEPKDELIPVSDTDVLTVQGGRAADRSRKLGEFGRTNSPLSAAEIEERKSIARAAAHGKRSAFRRWTPRSAENIHEIRPEPEH